MSSLSTLSDSNSLASVSSFSEGNTSTIAATHSLETEKALPVFVYICAGTSVVLLITLVLQWYVRARMLAFTYRPSFSPYTEGNHLVLVSSIDPNCPVCSSSAHGPRKEDFEETLLEHMDKLFFVVDKSLPSSISTHEGSSGVESQLPSRLAEHQHSSYINPLEGSSSFSSSSSAISKLAMGLLGMDGSSNNKGGRRDECETCAICAEDMVMNNCPPRLSSEASSSHSSSISVLTAPQLNWGTSKSPTTSSSTVSSSSSTRTDGCSSSIVVQTVPCKHLFHKKCLAEYIAFDVYEGGTFKTFVRCPLCRLNLGDADSVKTLRLKAKEHLDRKHRGAKEQEEESLAPKKQCNCYSRPTADEL